MPKKTCTHCKRSQVLSAYPKNKRLRDGHDQICKTCRAERERIRRRVLDPELAGREAARKKRNRLRMRRYDPFQLMVNAARTRARKRGVPCDIEANYLLKLWETSKGVCPVSGHEMDLKIAEGQGKRSPYKASLDRIVPSRGYVPGNVRLVCWAVNAMKQNMDDAELLDWCTAIVDTHRRKR